MNGLITLGSDIECGDIQPSGTRARLILMNYDEVMTVFTLNDKVTSVTLLPGKAAYEFTGFRNDVGKSEEVIKTGFKNRFIHGVSFVVYDVSQQQKNNLRRLAKARLMAIVESKGKSDDSIELLGREVGLQIGGGSIRDNQNVFTIGLSSPGGNEFELKLPITVGTDYEDGLEIIDEILNPGELASAFTIGFSFGFKA